MPAPWPGIATGPIFGTPLANIPNACTNAVNAPFLSTSQFAPSGALTGFGSMGRNAIYGPSLFDVDEGCEDRRARYIFSFGAQAFNLFNHANFDQPVNDIANPQFGSSIAAVGPPTSLLGSLVGAGSSPRFLEIKGIIRV